MKALKWILYAILALFLGLVALVYMTDDDPHKRKRH